MEHLSRGTLVTLVALAMCACSAGEGGEISPAVEARVVEAGATAADALKGTLITNLTGAMQQGGAVSAIEFCSNSAGELTAGVQTDQGLEIKRTTTRYRNPANAPDQAEAEALRHFETVLAETGELPAEWVQKVGRDEYRYYRSLSVAPPCLQCHGTSEEIDPAVQAILDERYPDDLATDYAVGDFRGLIRVSIPADRVEETGG